MLTVSPKSRSYSLNAKLSLISSLGPGQKIDNRGGYIAFVGLLFQITIGLQWTYGNVLPYIASYIAYHNASHPVSKSDYDNYTSIANYSFFLLITTMTFGAILGGKVELYFGPRIAILLASTFVSVGFGGTCFALLLNSIYLVLFSYGFLFGLGIGLGYPIIVVVCMRWFPFNQGRVCGIISAVFGGSPLIWDYLQELLANPSDAAMDDDVGYCLQKHVIDEIPYMFLKIAGIAVIMQIISLCCVKNPSWYIPEKDRDKTTEKQSKQQMKYEKYSLTVRQTVSTFTFWMFWINNFLYSYVLMFFAAEWKEFANQHLKIDNDNYLALMGSLGALCNGIGRFGWGIFYDWNKSFKISMGIQTFIVGVFVTTLPFINSFSFVSTETLFGIWLCCIWICVGCQFGFLPTLVSNTFGAKYTGLIVGLFIWCEAPASLMVVVITQCKDQIFGGWYYYIIFMGACSLVSTVLSVVTNENLDKKKIIQKAKEKQLLSKQFDEVSNIMNTKEKMTVNRGGNITVLLRSISEDSNIHWVGEESLGAESNATIGTIGKTPKEINSRMSV